MNNKRKRKRRIVFATSAAITVLSVSGIIVSCSNIKSTANEKYIGPRDTIRIYSPNPKGDPYANQPYWFTNPDSNYGLTNNIMGTVMNDTERNPLIRPVSIGVPNQVAEHTSTDPSVRPTIKNEGEETKTYFKFITAASLTLTYTDPKKPGIKLPDITYNSDQTPPAMKPGETLNSKDKLPWQSINSTPDNVNKTSDIHKTFSFIMQNMLITNISIKVRNNAYWSTNMGTATKIPITPEDYWYGLQLSHLGNSAYRLQGNIGEKGGVNNGGLNTTWDSNINQNLGGQVDNSKNAKKNDNWASSFSPYNIDTSTFQEGQEKTFTKNNSVNIPFKNPQKADGWNAFNGLFINQQFFNATSVVQTNKNRKNFSKYAPDNSLSSKYGYYANVYAANKTFKNILWGSPFACEGLFDTKGIYHKTEGLNLPLNTDINKRNRTPIKNVIWTFSKQTDTFPETQFQKYLQGSTVYMDKYALLSDHTKDVINNNVNTMGVHYSRNILSQVVKGDTTWGTLLPGSNASGNSQKAYYNNGFTEAMYGKSLKDTYTAAGAKNYFKHYYTFGTALRSEFSAAINWYTSILNFTKGDKSNWGSAFAKDMKINGKGKTTSTPSSKDGKDIMTSEYSYSYNGTNFSKPLTITPEDNKQAFIDNVSNQVKSFRSSQYAAIQGQVKKTLNAMDHHFAPKSIVFELPIRSYHGTSQEWMSLEGMRQTLNSLDPRLNVVAMMKPAVMPASTPDVKHPELQLPSIQNEKFNTSYKNEWNSQTLPRLTAYRSPTQSALVLHNIPNKLLGLGGFLNDIFKFNQYGGLTGFSAMLNAKANEFPLTGNIHALYNWVKTDFLTTWTNTLRDLNNSSIIKDLTNTNVKEAFKNLNIKTFSSADSQKILGGGSTGENYSAFTTLTNPKDQVIFNGIFLRLLTNLSRTIVTNMAKNQDTNTIKHILAGIDSYFGRTLGWMGRRIDNQDALPVTLQKTWYKVPKAESGIEFSSDNYVIQ